MDGLSPAARSGYAMHDEVARGMKLHRCLLLLLVSSLALQFPLHVPTASAAPAPGASTVPPEQRPLDEVAPYRRLLWVTRWDYRSEEDLVRIFYQAAQARFSDVFFQVRGEGTVFFRSTVEPWAWELSGKGVPGTGTDPGWDPLAVALREGHRYGLRVHAYLNMLPGWAQRQVAPAASGQLFAVHRSWFMMDASGKRMDPRNLSGTTYAFLDPALPEVRDHLSRLVGEMVRNYPVDGVHLDYIRYPYDIGPYSSYNPDSLAAFSAEHGGTPAERPAQWNQWRRDQITAVVRAVSQAARTNRPGVEVTAAVIADRQKRIEQGFQDVDTWLRLKLVDAVTPMAYTGEPEQFTAFCRDFELWRQRVWLGVWAKADRNPNLLRQVNDTVALGFPGVAVFSYSELFTGGKVTERVVGLYNIFTGQGS